MNEHSLRRRSWRSRIPGLRDDRGQAMVEFLVFLPVLLILLFAVIEVGMVISDQIALVHAAADGARFGSAPGCSGVVSCEASAATTQATKALTGINQCTGSAVAPSVSGANPQVLTVKVSCTYKPFTPLGSVLQLVGGAFGATLPLSATSIMRVAQ
jgi:Flp pilus assembly protein TadG